MKKMCAILAMLTAFSAISTVGVFAEEQEKLPGLEQKQDETKQSQYATISGTIKSVEKQEHNGETSYRVSVANEETEEISVVFTVNESTFIVNSKDGSFMTVDELKADMKLTGIVGQNTPMTLSLPPMTNPIGLVVGEENFVTVGYFDDELTSQDAVPMLQLNISEETKIVNQMGAKKIFTQDDVKNQDCLVVYGATTRSIPAQTNPVFVMIMDKTEGEDIEDAAKMEEAAKVEPAQTVETSAEKEILQATPLAPAQELPEVDMGKIEPAAGVEETAPLVPIQPILELPITKPEPAPVKAFVPLRETAESKGYTVTWTANDKPVVLQKDDVTIEITVGKSEYTKNDEILQAEGEAELMQSKIYIIEDIL